MSAELSQLLADVDAILLDFDGPVCGVFSGYPAHDVAADLVELLHRHGIQPPHSLAGEEDPLEILRWAGSAGDQDMTRMVEDALCEAEARAVEVATPTPYGREVIVAARQAGLPVAIVSNNSAGAVTAYLVKHRLTGHVASVVGRAYADPARMKPNPEPIVRGAETVGTKPDRSVIVGDSVSDIEGGKAAGVRIIGFANRPSKSNPLHSAGAEVVVTSMGPIAEALVGRCEAAEGPAG